MMKIDWQVMAQDDENRLTSESGIWWRPMNRWKNNMITIDWQMKAKKINTSDQQVIAWNDDESLNTDCLK